MKKISLATLAVLLAAGSMTVSTAARAQDAKAGEKKVAMCIGCHNIPGYQASFPETPIPGSRTAATPTNGQCQRYHVYDIRPSQRSS